MVNANRLWIIGGVIVAVLVVVLGWVVGVSPQLAAADAANQQRASVEAQNAASRAQLASLKKDYESIDELKSQLADLRQSVPATEQVSAFIREVMADSSASTVSLGTITVGAPSTYVPPAAAQAKAATGASTASPTSTPTATPAPTAAATPATTPAAAPTEPTLPVAPAPVTKSTITANNFVMLPVTLSATGDYTNVMDFISALQGGSRLFLVNSVATGQAGATGGAAASTATASIGGFVYVLLDGTPASTAK